MDETSEGQCTLVGCFYLHEMHKELAQASAEIDRGEISPLNIKAMTEHIFNGLENEYDPHV